MSSRDIIFAAAGGSPAPSDPNFENVTLLLNGNGTNGGQNNTFLDSSANNFSITRVGNITQGSFSPYGTLWSNYFDGSLNCYLSIPSDAGLSFGTGDFTVEMWMNPNINYGYSTAGNLDVCTLAATSGGFMIYINGGDLVIRKYAVADVLRVAQPSSYVWTHVAVVRNSGTTTIYYNGVSQGSTSDSNNYPQGVAYIGTNEINNNNYYQGYISNFRVVKGTAVYTGAFTPSTTPLTAITNTKLLTCQSNRFIDNSSSNLTITPNNKPYIQRFSPFEPSAPYSNSSSGGSAYSISGGGTSELNFTDSSNLLDIGGAVASIECWVYPTRNNGLRYIACKTGGNSTSIWDTTDGLEWAIVIPATDDSFQFQYNNAGSASTISGGSNIINKWTHLAVATDASNNISFYIDGVRVGTATNAITKPTTRTKIIITNGPESYQPFEGYTTDLRIIKGTGAYNPTSTTITIPTAPLTAVTNTQLLNNFTNASIIDSAAIADLETVGDAKLSTSVKKFGTASISFDGAGDYLIPTAPGTSLYAFQKGDFTIECWVYLNATTGTKYIYDGRSSATSNVAPSIYVNSSGVLIYQTASTTRITGSTLSTSTWYHIAVSRSGTSTKMFVDGTQVGSTFTDSNNYLGYANKPVIGSIYNGTSANSLNGYIDDLRITNGIARYTANFTAPTTAFPTYQEL